MPAPGGVQDLRATVDTAREGAMVGAVSSNELERNHKADGDLWAAAANKALHHQLLQKGTPLTCRSGKTLRCVALLLLSQPPQEILSRQRAVDGAE
jgi:hypothetical protein